ncbi:unnamed protein product [Boreogadus saida]
MQDCRALTLHWGHYQGRGSPAKFFWTGKQGEVIWSKIGPYKMFTADLQSLAPGKELESELDVMEWEVLIGAVCKDGH